MDKDVINKMPVIRNNISMLLKSESKDQRFHVQGAHPFLISDVWYPSQQSMIRINVPLLSFTTHRTARLYDTHADPEPFHNTGTFFSLTQTCCLKYWSFWDVKEVIRQLTLFLEKKFLNFHHIVININNFNASFISQVISYF